MHVVTLPGTLGGNGIRTLHYSITPLIFNPIEFLWGAIERRLEPQLENAGMEKSAVSVAHVFLAWHPKFD